MGFETVILETTKPTNIMVFDNVCFAMGLNGYGIGFQLGNMEIHEKLRIPYVSLL